jgi:hypothetical protein
MVSFLGNFTHVSIDCPAAEGPVIVEMPTESDEQIRVGCVVQLRWAPDAAVLLTT